jgi:glycosyltransferase involved in cell wall biosynthesis
VLSRTPGSATAYAGNVARGTPRLVSVVVPLLNAAGALPDHLEGLNRQDYTGAWEVVIADNGSTDDSVAIAEGWLEQSHRGHLIRAVERRSAGHARNNGAAHARGDFFAFTDADDVPGPGWLTAMAAAAQHGDVIAGAIDIHGLNNEHARSWHVLPPRERALRGYRFLPFGSGSNTGVWADIFHRLHGFDENWISGEDIDFSWRAQLASYRLAFAPEAVVQQRLRTGISALARQHYRYGTSGPRLYRRFRRSGMPRARSTARLRTWAWILCTWPAATGSERLRGRWALEAAVACGRLTSSARNRVLYI